MSRTGIKLTPDLLKSHIAEVIYEDREVAGIRIIHCHFLMDNGFTVYGKDPSTSIDPANFDVDKGKEVAYNKTFSQLWELEAYRALIENAYKEQATQSAKIDIADYISERGPINVDMGGNQHYTTGHCQSLVFHAPKDHGRGIVETFYNTNNPRYDQEQNDAASKRVEEYLRAHLGVEFLESDLVIRIAKICHESNRAYCQSIGDDSQPTWDKAPEWQKQSAVNGVKFHLTGDHQPSASHESWMAEKEAEGWVYGAVKDPAKKEHPCMVPYDQLTLAQKSKYHIFRAIVHSFK